MAWPVVLIMNIFYKYVKQFGENSFSTDDTMLYCNICNVKVSAEKNVQ